MYCFRLPKEVLESPLLEVFKIGQLLVRDGLIAVDLDMNEVTKAG